MKIHLFEAESDGVGEERRCRRSDLLAQLEQLREGQVLVAGQLDEDAISILQHLQQSHFKGSSGNHGLRARVSQKNPPTDDGDY